MRKESGRSFAALGNYRSALGGRSSGVRPTRQFTPQFSQQKQQVKMNKRTGLLALAVTAGLSTFSVAPAFAAGQVAEPVEQVCDEGTSGKQDVTESGLTQISITAPQGQLIASY